MIHTQLENVYVVRVNVIYDCNELLQKILRATSYAILLTHALVDPIQLLPIEESSIHGVGPVKALTPGKITPGILVPNLKRIRLQRMKPF